MTDQKRLQQQQIFNKSVQTFLKDQEEELDKQLAQTNPQLNKIKKIGSGYTNPSQPRKKYENKGFQIQKIKNTLEQTLSSLKSQSIDQNNPIYNPQAQNPLLKEYKKQIEEKDSKINQKDKQLTLMQRKEKDLSNNITNLNALLAKKNKKIQTLKQSIKGYKAKLVVLGDYIRNTRNQYKTSLNGHQQHLCSYILKIEQKINRIMAKKDVEQRIRQEQLIKEFDHQKKLIFTEIELTHRDICRMTQINLDQQLPFQQQNKTFYKLLQQYISYQGSFTDSQILVEISQKQWLLKNIGQCIGGKMLKTRMIFKLDQFNKTSFHKYIDKKYNILLLVRLLNGTTIGGFCHTPIEKDRIDKHKKGFLFSFTLNQKYEPKSDNMPLVSYDDFFLIFGNSEIRIKSQQTKVFSNFGTNAGVFNSRGKKVGDFLGGNSAEEMLSHFQIYQIQVIS